MKKPENSIRINDGIIFLILILITLTVYLPGINQLGYYRDDWNNVFNAYTQGADMLIRHYASDRPADGYLLSAAYSLFGPAPLPYLLINLVCRFLIGLLFYLTLRSVWKGQRFPAFVAAALFLIFPGFLRQVDGIAYLPHQIAMLCGMLSIFLTVQSLASRKKTLAAGLTLLSLLLAIAEMFLMEYYLGLEGLRLLLIAAYFYNRSASGLPKVIGRSLLRYLPWLFGTLLFFIWRSFLFDATRAGADLSALIRPFFEHPKFYGMDWLAKIVRNVFKLVVGSWTVPAYNVLNGIGFKLFWDGFLKALLPCAIFISGFILLMPERRQTPAQFAAAQPALRKNWRIQWMVIGLLGALAALIPLIIASREITFSSSLDRFSYHASYSAILLLVGLFSSIEGKWIKTALFGTLALSAIMTQIINKESYITQTRQTNDFWWQLSWRAPDIAEETLVMINMAAFSAEEDYEYFAPLHLIYYPELDHITAGSDVLNGGAVQKAQMGTVEGRKVREIFLWKDYSKILAVTQPSEQSCLQVIDGNNPIYSPREWSKIAEIGAYSQTDFILTEAEPHLPDPQLLGSEPAHGWCYFYQKMALAQQRENWDEVVQIGDEAIASGTHGEDPLEWLPYVQALAYSGRLDDAKPYGEILKTSAYLKFETCRYFRQATQVLRDPQPAVKALPWLEAEFCDS